MRDYIKKLREENKKSQKEIAASLGISANYYCYIETGQRQKNISINMLAKFAEIFNVPLELLIAEEQKLQSTAS